MAETASAFSREDEGLHNGGNSATAPGRRLLRRPTTAETERIAGGCPPRRALDPGDRRRDSTRNRLLEGDRVPRHRGRFSRRHPCPEDEGA